jgi:hypothetical protein
MTWHDFLSRYFCNDFYTVDVNTSEVSRVLRTIVIPTSKLWVETSEPLYGEFWTKQMTDTYTFIIRFSDLF